MDNSSDSFSSSVSSGTTALSPGRVALLALSLLILGTVVGYAFGVGVYNQNAAKQNTTPPALLAPVVKGMHASPDGKLLAFTTVYDQSRRAGRFVLDLKTHAIDVQETPYGWQDYIMQWSRDSRSLLFEREEIPRPVADAKAGFYQQNLKVAAADRGSSGSPGSPGVPPIKRQAAPPLLLSRNVVPSEEKIIAGFWTPDNKLVVKTRREPKALYLIQNGKVQLIDRTDGTYLQNRAVRENGRIVYYVVRNLPSSKAMALFRVQEGKARALTGALNNVEWIYVAEKARWMIVCYQAANGIDWNWELYNIQPSGARLVKKAQVPGDVIAVYWSPDLNYVLGAGGEALWLINIPSLQARRLGERNDWNADDAAWIDSGRNIAVAADGKLWRINIQSGLAEALWQFPDRYWS